MNAERLHAITRILNDELREHRTVTTLQSLVNTLQQIVQQNNQGTQQNLVGSRDGFYQAVANTPSDSFTPAWRQILIEIGGDDLFGKNLKQWVEKILAENQMTPGVAQQKLAEILDRLQKFSSALDQLISAFNHFKIGYFDHGFNFEVRIELPKALNNSKESEEIQQAAQAIKDTSQNMQYMKLEGPPILALPEKIEPRVTKVTAKKSKKVKKGKAGEVLSQATETNGEPEK
jgi:hypothetical protein